MAARAAAVMTGDEAKPVNSPARTWRATVLTLFPEMFPGPLGASLAGQALERGAWRLETLDIRGFARDKHRSVDDAPFGGGPGMVMKPDVADAAIAAAKASFKGPEGLPLVYMTPRGRPLDQAQAQAYADGPGVIVLCGRFEGVDQRVLEAHGAEEVSLGDFVLSGGEIPAMALIDACVRLLPGVMGAEASKDDESFQRGLLEYPHYTRPQDWRGHPVPEVLVSGDHGRIKAWRDAKSEEITRERRPDLWAAYERKKDTPDV